MLYNCILLRLKHVRLDSDITSFADKLMNKRRLIVRTYPYEYYGSESVQ